MNTIYDRAKLLIGEEGQNTLTKAHVAVVGIGGVGSFVAEALARAGIGKLTLIDHDTIDITNLNRQLHALQSTIGQPKVQAMAKRIKEINPDLDVVTKEMFILPDNIDQVLDESYDYLVDAIDTVTGKLALVVYAKEKEIPVVCSMGTGNKLDNTHFEIVDISQTHVCPLARVMRKELKKRGIESGVQVVYTPIPVMKPNTAEGEQSRRETPGSMSYVPGTAGLIIAGLVVRTLLDK